MIPCMYNFVMLTMYGQHVTVWEMDGTKHDGKMPAEEREHLTIFQ